MPSARQIAVFEEDVAIAHIFSPGKPHDLLNQSFRGVIVGIGLARDHNLHGSLVIAQDPRQTIGIVQ